MTIDTARLRALAEAATPGPWTAKTWTPEFHDEMRLGYVEVDGSGYELWDTSGGNTVAEARDAEFIAAADPPTMLALLDEIERLRGNIGHHGLAGRILGAIHTFGPDFRQASGGALADHIAHTLRTFGEPVEGDGDA